MFKEYHTDMSMMEYLKLSKLSSSDLHNFSISPFYYRKMKEKPLSANYLSLGTAVHRILESRTLFDQEYVVRPDWVDLRTKEGKLWKSDAGNRIVLSSDDHFAIMSMYDNLMASSDRLINAVLCADAAQNEVVHTWVEDDLECKCRTDRLVVITNSDTIQYLYDNFYIDAVKDRIVIAVDYKTSSHSIDYHGFSHSVRKYGYDLKAAHYVVGTECDLFMWVVMESVYPHQVARYMLSPAKRDSKLIERKRIIDQFKLCSFTNQWLMNEQNCGNTFI